MAFRIGMGVPEMEALWNDLSARKLQGNQAKAVVHGFQIDVTRAAQEAGIRFPVFLTRAVFDNCVAVPEGVPGPVRLRWEWKAQATATE